jgi:hypothetical protein
MTASTTRRRPRDFTFHLKETFNAWSLEYIRVGYTFNRRQLTGREFSNMPHRYRLLYDSPQAFVGLGPRAVLACLFMVFGVTFTSGEGRMVEVRATSYLRGLSGPAYVLSGVCFLDPNTSYVRLQICLGKIFGN